MSATDLEPTERAAPGAHVTALDGLRGLAIAGVVAFHGLEATVPGGFLGVSLFFTISGFLIGRLLIGPAEQRRSLRSFASGRARRIAPAGLAGIALAVVAGALWAEPAQVATLRGDVVASLIGITNWWFIVDDQSYGALFGAPSLLLPYWSLAIEVQLYLMVPLLLVVLRGAGQRWRPIAIGIVGLAALAGTALAASGVLGVDATYYATPTRAPELLIGVLAALVVGDRRLDAPGWSAPVAAALTYAGSVALVMSLVLWGNATLGDGWVSRGGLSVYAAMSALVVVGVLGRDALLGRALSVAPLRWLGLVSYGLYAYHWPVFALLSPSRTGWSEAALFAPRVAVSLVLAVASLRLLEQPVRLHRGWRGVRWRLPIAGAAALTLVAVLVVTVGAPARDPGTSATIAAAEAAFGQVDTSPVLADGPYDPPGISFPPVVASPDLGSFDAPWSPDPDALAPASSTTPSRPLRVLVVGDSTAFPLGRLLGDWGGQTGLAEVTPLAAMGCGLLAGGERLGARGPQSNGGDCDASTALWDRAVDRLAPDVIVVASGLWDATDHRAPEEEVWRSPGDPVHDERLRRTYGEIADRLHADRVPVVWLTAPPIHWKPTVRGGDTQEPAPNDPGRMATLDGIVRDVAATRPFVEVVDYAAFYRHWPGGPFDGALRPDGVHVDPEADGAGALAGWLGPEVLAAYWTARERIG